MLALRPRHAISRSWETKFPSYSLYSSANLESASSFLTSTEFLRIIKAIKNIKSSIMGLSKASRNLDVGTILAKEALLQIQKNTFIAPCLKIHAHTIHPITPTALRATLYPFHRWQCTFSTEASHLHHRNVKGRPGDSRKPVMSRLRARGPAVTTDRIRILKPLVVGRGMLGKPQGFTKLSDS